jgi:hypothetical protein
MDNGKPVIFPVCRGSICSPEQLIGGGRSSLGAVFIYLFKVKAGTSIAIVGNTGNTSTGTHLHFELWHKGEAVDPTRYIKF